MAYIPDSGSVVSYQSNPSVLQTLTGLMSTNASVITVGGSGVANQSVSGTVGASLIGLSPVSVSNFPATQTITGSVQQGTTPWVVSQNGSIAAVIVGGSIAASFTPPANQSVSGTVQADIRGSVAAVIIGGSILTTTGNSSVQVLNFPTNQSVSGAVSVSNFPTTQNVSGSVAAWLQSTNASIITVGGATGNSSVQVLNFPANQSVSGTVGTTQSGTWISSIVNTVPSSVLVGASLFGQLPAGTAMLGSVVSYQGAVWNVAGSIAAFQAGTRSTSVSGQVTVVSSLAGGIFPISGSVAATITNTNINVSGSIVAFQGGTVITSISGVPQASIHGSVSIVPASVITAHGSVAGAGSVQLFSATSGLRNYVTAFLVSNTGAATTLVTFTDGDSSIIGKTIAPAGGGSNAPALATPFIPSVNKVVNAAAATATSVLHVWVGGYRAP